jgi:hypothetical protein
VTTKKKHPKDFAGTQYNRSYVQAHMKARSKAQEIADETREREEREAAEENERITALLKPAREDAGK